jgi:arylsulfatase A-like enzyme
LARDLDDASLASLRATYYALMTEVDHHVGRLLDHLRASGRLDETLVVFTADHGEYLGDHHLFGKVGAHPEAFHIPLIVRDPRAGARGIVVDRFTESVDVMPTVLEALDLPVPVQCDGAALTPWIRGETPTGWRDAVHWEIDYRTLLGGAGSEALGMDPDRASLVGQLTDGALYVHFAAQPPMLFDLAADPLGHRDLAADPTSRDRRLAALSALMTWRMRHENRLLSNLRVGAKGLQRWRD